MQMPVMDGAETIRHIRASDQPFQTVPVIALTASAMVGDRERFLRMGIDGYIPKPVDESSLVSEIADILCRTAF
ncbi:MAG: response regulator, partial [Pseudomonadota bacterium]